MATPIFEQIIESRRLLQNPYAHMEELIEFGVLEDKTVNTEISFKNNSMNTNHNTPLKNGHPKIAKIANSNLVPSQSAMQDPYTHTTDNVQAISRYALFGNPYASIDENDTKVKINTQAKQHISQIEQIARDFQRKIWGQRNQLWPNGVPTNPVDLLDPSVAFNSIGYDYDIYETLDDYSNGENFKIAGLIDQSNKKAYISNQFPLEVQRFTSAHELGHALMHQGSGMHRDRGLDGSPIKGKKDKIEIEADKFAAFFLMPRNLVIRRFKEQFGVGTFTLNEDTIFALDPRDKKNLMANKKNLRFISRVLAETNYYNNQHLVSLSKQFRVSVEAMAIRLEELGLLGLIKI